MKHTWKSFALVMLITSSLAACTNLSPTTDPASSSSTTTITGQAIAGAVTGMVTANDSNNKQLATANVSKGEFTLTLQDSDLNQVLRFEVTGTYTDEASGLLVSLDAANPLALHTKAKHFSAGKTGNAPITPDSTIIHHLVQAGKTLAQAEAAFQSTFGYKPDLTAKPFDPYANSVAPTGATAADKNAAFRVGILSQLGRGLGLSASDLAELPHKFALDLADGALDGVGNGNPIAFGSGVDLKAVHAKKPLANHLAMAVSAFAGSAANKASIKTPSMGLPPIVADAAGKTKAITLADGTSIHVTLDTVYASPFQPGFNTAKTTHTISLTDANNLPYTGATSLMVMPMMYMNTGHAHGTAHAMVNKSQAASGVYTVDLYYFMASGMNNMPMGQWELDVKLGDPTSASMMDPYAHAYFYPNVKMNMGNDVWQSKVSNTADQWTNRMGMSNPREYRVWLQGATNNGDGTHALSVFISTQNMAPMGSMSMGVGMSGMPHGGMGFPAVYAGTLLHDKTNALGMRPAKTLNSVVVKASADGINFTAMAHIAPMGMNTGKYTATVTGLTADVYVQLTVDNYTMLDAAGNTSQLRFSAP